MPRPFCSTAREAISQELLNSCRLPPITKKHAPQTSHDAGKRYTNSGKRDSMIVKVAEAVRKYPGRTAAELAEKPELRDCGLNPLNAVRSRLSELQDESFPSELRVRHSRGHRTCRVHGTQQVIWWVV